MNYLIDGHNLIGKLPDIKLSDPDDEAQLVLKLINWQAVGHDRRVIVVFDGGVPGIQWARFRSDHIKTVFVPKGRTADSWLIQFMKREVRDPRQFTLITSDHEIIKVAKRLLIKQMSSDQFADNMIDEMARLLQGDTDLPDTSSAPLKPLPREDPKSLSNEEVAAWMDLFGGEPEIELQGYKRRLPQPPPQPVVDDTGQVVTDPDDMLLSPDEVSEWLTLFGGEPEVKKSKSAEKPATAPSKPTQSQKSSPHLSQSDMELWQNLFGDDK
jgi:predicted RNA-binding protein with PIN domain